MAPRWKAGIRVTKAPLNTMAPVCSTTDSGVMRQAAPSVSAYMLRTRWLCMMPLGSPVVPEVYMMLNRSSGPTSAVGGSHSGAAAVSAA